MKKISFAIFIVALVSLFASEAFAQEVKKEVKEVVKKEVQEKVEVKLSELPEAVTKTLGEQYADYTAEKAYKKSKEGKEVYYIKLSKDGAIKKVLLSADGTVIKEKDGTDS